MVSDIRRVAAWSALTLSIIVMLGVALFKMFWLSMGTLALDGKSIPRIYVINLVQAPAYLVSALTAWKWPYVAKTVSMLTLIALLTKIISPPVFPYQDDLFFEYAFILAANVAFLAMLFLRGKRMRDA